MSQWQAPSPPFAMPSESGVADIVTAPHMHLPVIELLMTLPCQKRFQLRPHLGSGALGGALERRQPIGPVIHENLFGKRQPALVIEQPERHKGNAAAL